jgi:hypothetical protein
MPTKVEPDALKDTPCPLCGQRGTLRLITLRRRMRVGLLSFANNLGKTHECTHCGAKV